MSLIEGSRHGKEGRDIRLLVKNYKIRIAQKEANEQIREFWAIGEPSAGIFPPPEENLDIQSQVVFSAATPQKREGDLAKRRGVIINTILENPKDYPLTKKNRSFFQRQGERMRNFAITARNKGQIHPRIKEILGL